MIKKFLILFISLILFYTPGKSEQLDEMFFIGKMDSYNKDFTLFFKTS